MEKLSGFLKISLKRISKKNVTSQHLQFCDKAHNRVSQELNSKDVIFKNQHQHSNCAIPTSCVPWEKFKRAMFIPDLIISFSISTEREAGPAENVGNRQL